MVKLHHLNCGTMRPIGFFPFSTIPLNNTGRMFHRGFGVIHCLLLATDAGLILIDSGYGLRDYENPTPFVRLFNRLIGLQGDAGQTAYRQLQELGYHPDQVSHIILTHMHLDHTGGLPDFPQAMVHVFEPEWRAALAGSGLSSLVYIKQHWAHGPKWKTYRLQGDTWHGLECTPKVRIAQLEFFFVPMVGHSPGHCVAVISLSDERWVIHAGDAYGYRGQIDPVDPHYPPYHRLFRPLLFSNRITRSMFAYDETLQGLRQELGDRLQIFCSHDPHEFMKMAGSDAL
jgi:glyoxylase-like metal-dependent hydrolase (beta-lactamase superfamily II)